MEPTTPPSADRNVRNRVVVIGGGFGGLEVAKRLRHQDAVVTLIDRRNFHLFQPLLYQVATGTLSPANIAAPLRSILRRRKNVRVILDEVVGFDPTARNVIGRSGHYPYDTLVVAAGARHGYFGRDDWEAFAPGLKTIEDATEIRRRILLAFEAAEREPDPYRQQEWLTFVVVGAGPTGVELAGALAETARHTLRRDFRTIDPAQARIVLIEGADRVLGTYPSELSAKAATALERLKVDVRLSTIVIGVDAAGVDVKAAGQVERIPTRTVIWAAGVHASPLGRSLAEAFGAELDRAGRVFVTAELTLPAHPEVFVIGDLANTMKATGTPLPGMAPVAMQQGRYVARAIAARLDGHSPAPFVYRDRGTMATIGRAAAVADLGWIRFSGFFAWLAWLFIHLMYLVQFHNRVLVLLQWGWHYLTWNRAARLITGCDGRRSEPSRETAPAPADPLAATPATTRPRYERLPESH